MQLLFTLLLRLAGFGTVLPNSKLVCASVLAIAVIASCHWLDFVPYSVPLCAEHVAVPCHTLHCVESNFVLSMCPTWLQVCAVQQLQESRHTAG